MRRILSRAPGALLWLMFLTCDACGGASRESPPKQGSPPAPVVGRKTAKDEHPGVVAGYGYQIELVDETGDTVHAADLRAWLIRAMQSTSETTGGSSELLRVVARPGSENGSTRDSVITMRLPNGPRPPTASTEWVLHHELIHASFPSLSEEDLWLEEGLATYLEPLARVRTGQLQATEVWGEWLRDMPQGAPQPGEGGLRGTHTWHRLYWQGAVFWLQAELAVYQRTQGRHSLHEALCAWAHAGSQGGDWTGERAFTLMDEGLGEPILLELFREASARGIGAEPRRLLADLGISSSDGGELKLEASAPAAVLRERMMHPQIPVCGRPTGGGTR